MLAEIRNLAPEQATARMQQLYAEPIKPDLVTARLAEIRAAGVIVAGALSPAAHAGALRDRRRRRRRPLRDPRHHGLGRARLEEPGAAEPQEVHLRARRARDRGRRGHLHRCPAPHAHRRGGRARRLRRRRGVHHARDARHPRPHGHGGGGCRGRSPRLPRRVRRPLRARHRRRRCRQVRRHRQGHRLRRRRRDARRGARARDRRARRRLPLGRRGAPLQAPARPARARGPGGPARGGALRPGARRRRHRRTSSARSAARWRPPGTPTSRSSSASRSWSRRTRAPERLRNPLRVRGIRATPSGSVERITRPSRARRGDGERRWRHRTRRRASR